MAKRGARGPDLSVQPDPCPTLVVERGPDNTGVGPWVPEQKYRLLCRYLDGSRGAWAKWQQRVFIDPFCGPGRIQVRDRSQTSEGGVVLAWRTLARTAPFTHVFVGDIAADRVHACEARLAAIGAPVRGFVGPAVDTTRQMVALVPPGALCMAYIDPYNLAYLDFSIIEALHGLKNVDLAINFSTMDLKRNADHETDPERARFDKAAPGWRDHVRNAKVSRSGLPLALLRYWLGLVENLGFKYSEAMPMVTNDLSSELYRMVFLSRHPFPERIWGDVARNRNKDLFD